MASLAYSRCLLGWVYFRRENGVGARITAAVVVACGWTERGTASPFKNRGTFQGWVSQPDSQGSGVTHKYPRGSTRVGPSWHCPMKIRQQYPLWISGKSPKSVHVWVILRDTVDCHWVRWWERVA